MNNLQKIVVLCFILFVGIYIGMNWDMFSPNKDQSMTQVDPPSMELEAGPEDKELEQPEEPEAPIAVEPEPTPTPEPEPEMVACTMDAKQCPDGSYVGRVAPNCEFAECPKVEIEGIVCTDEQKQAEICTMEYAPVCGLVEVQCITTPCDPVPETFGNACSACASGKIDSYTEGECGV